jgi:hypothetical protein
MRKLIVSGFAALVGLTLAGAASAAPVSANVVTSAKVEAPSAVEKVHRRHYRRYHYRPRAYYRPYYRPYRYYSYYGPRRHYSYGYVRPYYGPRFSITIGRGYGHRYWW